MDLEAKEPAFHERLVAQAVTRSGRHTASLSELSNSTEPDKIDDLGYAMALLANVIFFVAFLAGFRRVQLFPEFWARFLNATGRNEASLKLYETALRSARQRTDRKREVLILTDIANAQLTLGD